jgi:tetratricopeptide (TPR) repeat protein
MMTTADSIGDAVTPDDIRAALHRMTGSDVFSRSPQLGAFLRFVVEAVLQGKAGRIKAYTIGVEVLRRDAKFDPQLDPIVRVEATRLRRAIERYYAGPGATDPVIVDLPRGSYVPTFRRREMARRRAMPSIAAVGRWADALRHPLPSAWLVVMATIVIVSLAAVFLYGRRDDGIATATIAVRDPGGPNAHKPPPGNGMPTIQIEPLRVIGSPSPNAIAAERLYAKISDAFARFDTINVASSPVPANATADTPAADPRIDYRLSGAIEYSGDAANAWFTLTSSAEGKVVWSRTFERVQPVDAEGVTEDSIVISLTNSLLQSYGVIRARDRANQLASNAGDPRYRCILEAADAIRTSDRQTYELARACLEHLTSVDPGFAVGFTFLAMIYNREFQLGYEPRPGESPALDRALRAVRQAIALHPEGSRGYLVLMVIQSNRRDIAAALAAGDKSLTLNKYDMLALGEYGGRLILAGDVDKGMKMLRDAGAHGAVRPSWHHIYMFIGSYVGGDMQEAVRQANDITVDDAALGQVARVLAARAVGNQEGVRKAVERLIALGPGWRRDPRAELARLIPGEVIVDRLSRDLAAAGLPGGA